jgi:PEP-CTERM motif
MARARFTTALSERDPHRDRLDDNRRPEPHGRRTDDYVLGNSFRERCYLQSTRFDCYPEPANPRHDRDRGHNHDAIAINFTNFAVGPNHVNGAVDIGQSMASIAIIPEPATWAMMLAGFGALGLLTWGRTRAKSAARV